MSQVILKAENISKQYRLGTVGTGTLSHDLNRWWHKVRGKEDPYLKVGSVNDRSTEADSEYVWALRDINFEVQQGEVLGIIGKNGAGKSTLLKILSRVTSPTTGEIKTRGRIASLLEVGTGFHPELTGRENIYLNGAILGMTKKEIRAKEDAIIDFSGCARYVDTPVKRYSSGMRVRLAFAVAAFLEPDILVIDEVLAVGDAEFQKKAIGKMQDISQGEGRTVLFVSHNMESIQQLCTRCLVLKHGSIAFEGATEEAVELYLDLYGPSKETKVFPIQIQGLSIENLSLISKSTNSHTLNLILGQAYDISLKVVIGNHDMSLNVRYQFIEKNKGVITTLNTYHKNATPILKAGEEVEIVCRLDALALAPGSYYLGVQLLDLDSRQVLFEDMYFYSLDVVNGDFYNTGKLPNPKQIGKVLTSHEWLIN